MTATYNSLKLMSITLCDEDGIPITGRCWHMEVGEQYPFQYCISNQVGNPAITWHTSDSNIFAVDENGLVTAYNTGSAILTIKLKENSIEHSCSLTISITTTAEFGSCEYSINGRTVYLKWIKTNYDQIIPTYIGANAITATNYCGTNGTFFINNYTEDGTGETDRRYILSGVAIYNGEEIYNYGRANRFTINGWWPNGTIPEEHGTLVKLKTPLPDGTIIFADRIASFENYTYKNYPVEISDIHWAVGGTDLFMSQNLSTQQEFVSLYGTNEAPAPTGKKQRCAIAYLENESYEHNILLLTVFGDDVTGEDLSGYSAGGVTLFELRTILKEKFNASIHTIAMDGGGSVQIQYKENGILNYQVVNNVSNGEKAKRAVYSMMRVKNM